MGGVVEASSILPRDAHPEYDVMKPSGHHGFDGDVDELPCFLEYPR